MKKVNLVLAILFVILTGVSSLFAQLDRGTGKVKDPIDVRIERAKMPTLGCCKCLEGSNTLDLSTIQGNDWTVNGNPVSFLTSPSTAWNIVTGGAKWVSYNSSGATGGAPGEYLYKLKFFVPNCAISQEIMLTGTLGADNNVTVLLDNNPVSTCTGSYCFKAGSTAPPPINTAVGPGQHELIVKVKNESGPTGMFINAKLVSKCSTKLTKDER